MRIGIVLVATTLAVVGIPYAAADEADPDCEAGQMGIGYLRTQPVWTTWSDLGTPGGIFVCEGEHWDGQDTVSSRPSDNCASSVNPSTSDLFVSFCGHQDPNAGPSENALEPVGARVSSDGSSAYTGVNIGFVGRAVLYVDDSSVGVYLRDNTPTNVLATVVSAARLTQGHVAESDCDQAYYQEGAIEQNAQCGRDNTAVTVEHDLLS